MHCLSGEDVMTTIEIKQLSSRLHNGSQIKVFYKGHYITDASVTKVVVSKEDTSISIYYKPHNLVPSGQDATCEISESSHFSVKIVGEE